MSWEVPTAEDCPYCGKTMFKKSGKGQKKVFCINEECENFTPEELRGGYRKKKTTEEPAAEGTKTEAAAEVTDTAAKKTKKTAEKKTAAKKTAKKTTAKKPAAKKTTKTAAKTTKKPAAKKTAKATEETANDA